MTQKRVVVFGATGGIGEEVVKVLEQAKEYSIFPYNSTHANFSKKTSNHEISSLLTYHEPDIIINCAGIFGKNDSDFKSIFNINVRANWEIIDYYKKNTPEKTVKIIAIGSSAYKGGRSEYILYAASKAALFSMFAGAKEYFNKQPNNKVILGLVNPTRVKTQMIKNEYATMKSPLWEPSEVAGIVMNLIEGMSTSTHVDMGMQVTETQW